MPLGRTNKDYPPVWIKPGLPESTDQVEQIAEVLANSSLPVDLSGYSSLWGNHLYNATNPILMRFGAGLHRTVDADHATDQIQAEFIEKLCCIRRERIEIAACTVSQRLQEFQIEGALRAFENAIQEGHFKFLCLHAVGAFASQTLWQFRDGFEILLLPNPSEQLEAMARSKRVGIVHESHKLPETIQDQTILLSTNSLEQIQQVATGVSYE